jgi:hypothetical protein
MTGASSILVADCGSTLTTVALIERVNGHHRLVARGEANSTHRAPWMDAIIGVREAIQQIESLVGRRFLTPAGDLIKSQIPTNDGVDIFVAVSSAGAALRVVLAGLTGTLSLASAQRAAAGTYAHIAGVLAMDEGPAPQDPDARMRVLRQAQPEIILIAGGTDGGATRSVVDLAQLIVLYNQVLEPERRPLTFYAGNAHLATDIATLFADSGKLRVVPNVRPGLDLENLGPAQAELEAIYQRQNLEEVSGFDTLSQWSGRPIFPTTRSFGQLIHYLGDRYQLKVVGIDLGSTSTSLAARSGDLFSLTTRVDMGIGLSVKEALKQIPLDHIMRWLPFEIEPAHVQDMLLNKWLRPASVPKTQEGMLLEYALAREVMRQVVAQARPGWLHSDRPVSYVPQWDLMVGAGRMLTLAPHPGYAALLLLDALEPTGVSQITLDTGGIATTLGAVASVHPLAAAEVVEYDAFLNLGTVVAPVGTARLGEIALRVKVSYLDGRVAEKEVACGSIEVIPLEAGEKATLELHPTRRFDIGLGEPGRSVTAEAEGGLLGLVIDARGRPLDLPVDDTSRRKLLQEWLDSMVISQRKQDTPQDPANWLHEAANQGVTELTT